MYIFTFSRVELPKHVNDIAIIEVKKLNEAKGSSSYYNIRNFARQDKDFIKEQIELINPDIIFCCNTGDFYCDDIYGDEDWQHLICVSKCNCYKHGNRVVIDFYHPSTRSKQRDKELFDILHRMIKQGNVFEMFS